METEAKVRNSQQEVLEALKAASCKKHALDMCDVYMAGVQNGILIGKKAAKTEA